MANERAVLRQLQRVVDIRASTPELLQGFKTAFARAGRTVLLAVFLAGAWAKADVPSESQVIQIATGKSALTLFVGEDGRLYQLGYGEKGRQFDVPDRGPSRESEFYPQYGDGYILEPALQATHADGNTSTTLVFDGKQTEETADGTTLTRIRLKDRHYPFQVTLCFRAYPETDMIEQWVEIRHEEDGDVTLYRFASSAPQIAGKECWLTQFHGDYKREATLEEEKLTRGLKILDSKIGVRASRYRIPSFLVAMNGPADEEKGEVIGGSLKWSGSFQLAFDVDWRNHLRALCGINPFASQYHLKRGETFTTPGMLWTWSDQGKGQVSRNFHRWARQYGIRDGDKPRPVLLNNWEATHMNFDEEKIVSLFDGAKDLGIELFLLDDGWFGNRHPRDNDHAGLGDWQVNTNKLPHGLSYLADEAHKRGIRFGIWLEPEMVNPSSDLFETHPDWAIQQPHRELEYSRNQLDLDLSRPEGREFAWKVVDDTLGPNPGIEYVKWDANRYVTQPGSPYLSPKEQSHLLIDYNFALYDIMSRMAKQYPNVMAMVCSGGGGRVDYGALQYFHSFWPSDNTDPAKRVFIQWGFSHFFPACAISAHVTKMGNRPIKFATDVALSGAFGVDMDVAELNPEEREVVRHATALYKEHLRKLVSQSDLYRLESPYDGPRAVLSYVAPDRKNAVVFVYQLQAGEAKSIRLRGLDPEQRYQVREVNLTKDARSRLKADGEVMGGVLMRDGLVPPCHNPFDSAVIELTTQ